MDFGAGIVNLCPCNGWQAVCAENGSFKAAEKMWTVRVQTSEDENRQPCGRQKIFYMAQITLRVSAVFGAERVAGLI